MKYQTCKLKSGQISQKKTHQNQNCLQICTSKYYGMSILTTNFHAIPFNRFRGLVLKNCIIKYMFAKLIIIDIMDQKHESLTDTQTDV